jgi:hypothetical protein
MSNNLNTRYFSKIAHELISQIDAILVKLENPSFTNSNAINISEKLKSLKQIVSETQKKFQEEVSKFDGGEVIMVKISKMDSQLQKLRNLNAKFKTQEKLFQNELNRIKVMSDIELKKQSIRALINSLRRNIGNNTNF